MTGPWGPAGPGDGRGNPFPDGEPGGPQGLQPPAPDAEPGDRLPGSYGGPPHDGGIPDGEPGAPDAVPGGGSGAGPGGAGGRGGVGGPPGLDGGGDDGDARPGRGAKRQRPGPWRPPAKTGPDGSPDERGPEQRYTDSRGPVGEAPEDVHTAWVLWLAATAFALVGAIINAFTSRVGDLPQATRDLLRDTVADAGSETADLEGLFAGAMLVSGVLALAAAGVTIWLAFRMKSGAKWARTLLSLISVFLVVDAIAVLVSVFSDTAMAGSRGEGLTFVVFSCQILAGLCAGTAVWRQYSMDSEKYFSGAGSGSGSGSGAGSGGDGAAR